MRFFRIVGSNPTFSVQFNSMFNDDKNFFLGKNLTLTISSCNKDSLERFINFVRIYTSFESNSKFKIIRLSPTKTLVSLLKSPHVNKTAQEQFYREKFSSVFVFKEVNKHQLMLALKSVLSKGFSDINLKLTYSFSPVENECFFKKKLNSLNPDFKASNISLSKTEYLSLLDAYGEILNQNPLAFLAQLDQSSSLLS